MKYAIFKGDIVIVKEEGNNTCFVLADEEQMVPKTELKIVPEEIYRLFEPELLNARTEIKALLNRLDNLDKSYNEKREALRHMLVEARRKEIAVVSKALGGALSGKEKEKAYAEGKTIEPRGKEGT